jgi:hypothetical protein
MPIGSIFESLQDTDFLTALRESAWVYPIILSTHLACIAVFGGLIFLTDLRLLGVSLRGASVSEVVGRLRPWKWLGFIIMVTCGLLLGGAKAATYYANPYFQIKMTLLVLVGVHALVFRRSVYGNTAELDRLPKMPGTAKLAAALSMVLWVGILSAGRWIAYYEPATPNVNIIRGLTPPKILITSMQPQRSRIFSKGDK